MMNDPIGTALHAREAFLPFLDVLRRVVHRRDAQATHVTRADLLAALRFVAVGEDAAALLRPALGGRLPARAGLPDLQQLLRVPVPEQPLRFAADIHDLMMSVFATVSAEQLRPHDPSGGSLAQARTLLRKLEQAALQVPGQQAAGRQAALELAMQLAHPRKTPARLLLHGPHGGGANAMALHLARTLKSDFGYSLCEIDCSQARDDYEAGLWDGIPGFWKDARPGVVTWQMHAHPRSVVVFLNFDRTLPRVMECLRGALADGEMVDNFGFGERLSDDDGRRGTRVDCSRSIFLFTAAAGAEWYDNPDMACVLGAHDGDAANTMREAMRGARREVRGHATPVFDEPVLAQIEPHLVMLRPQTWPTLLDQATAQLRTALDDCRQRLALPALAMPGDDARRLAAAHLLSQGAQAGLAATEAVAIHRNLLAPLEAAALAAGGIGRGLMLRLDAAARAYLDELLVGLGEDPLRALGRKRQVLRFDRDLRIADSALTICNLRLHAAQQLADYTGSVRLEARVPDLTLDAVAGHDKAKAFLREIIGYLHDPKAVRALGIGVPRGALLTGPPGTGKTMLAQAFAGEAGLPFIAAAGTDLLAPERVGALYSIAKRNAPCVVFIDEVDALGARGTSAAHDAALNKLLVEIQGFSSTAPVFHILATNRPGALDDALTRAGRIDRRFYIGPLDRAGRVKMVERILALCEPAAGAIERLLGQTSGMTGAELEQVRRECGLRLLRQRRERLAVGEAIEELNRVKYGDQAQRRADKVYRERLAVHEIGHALVHHHLSPEVEIAQISIAPREGGTAGFLALNSDDEAPVDQTPSRIKAVLATLLAGREAERVRYGDDEGRSVGASTDLARATRLAWQAVAHAGLDSQFGNMSLLGFSNADELPRFLAEEAWQRAREWVEAAGQQARALLREHALALDELVALLLEREVLEGADFAQWMREQATRGVQVCAVVQVPAPQAGCRRVA
jgi:cell division protease FtsH